MLKAKKYNWKDSNLALFGESSHFPVSHDRRRAEIGHIPSHLVSAASSTPSLREQGLTRARQVILPMISPRLPDLTHPNSLDFSPGSDVEKKVKKGAAETEEAWTGAGQQVGLRIWRIVQVMKSVLSL